MIYVDQTFRTPSGRWCHMMVDKDSDLEELHNFAARAGLKRTWFQDKPGHPHYDLTVGARKRAVRLGAVELSDPRDMIKLCWRREEHENHILNVGDLPGEGSNPGKGLIDAPESEFFKKELSKIKTDWLLPEGIQNSLANLGRIPLAGETGEQMNKRLGPKQ